MDSDIIAQAPNYTYGVIENKGEVHYKYMYGISRLRTRVAQR
jgi:hypothetical protein